MSNVPEEATETTDEGTEQAGIGADAVPAAATELDGTDAETWAGAEANWAVAEARTSSLMIDRRLSIVRTALAELVGTEEMYEVRGVLAEDDAEEGKVTEVTAGLDETVEVVGVKS